MLGSSLASSIGTLRNIGIIAHIDAGKTTVTEGMLFCSGAKHRVGQVDKGTTTTDDDTEEEERGITIYSACVALPWKGVQVNLIDTPGHVDFTAEVERSLRVLDGGVVVFSAREGVEAQSETVWRQANKYGVPRVAMINKMDREGADFEGTLQQIESRLGARPVAIQIPVGQGPAHVDNPFRAIIDLVAMKMVRFPEESQGKKVLVEEIPESLQAKAQEWREAMLDGLYDYSNELMELALQEESLPEKLIEKVIREATIAQQIQPVLCGSALHGIGVPLLLDAVEKYLPSPLDVPPVQGEHPKTGEPESRQASVDEPFCGLVFKILPFKTGDLYWVRVYSGEMKSNMRAFNPGKQAKENVSQIWRIHASKREEQLPNAQAGDIVGVIGPRQSVTGDTFCDAKSPVLLESIEFPEPVISMAIEPEATTERKKLSAALDMLRKQDPTFRAQESEETGQTIISGMGELHLEVIAHRLTRDFNVKVKVRDPRVSYRETVDAAVEVIGECDRQVAGQQLSAKVQLQIEPATGGGPPVVEGAAAAGTVAGPALETILEVLREQAAGGGSLGFPLIDVRIRVVGAELDEVESTDVAIRIATADAFSRALRQAGIVLLEPIMQLEITAPEENLGDFVGDLQQRRAVIHQTDNRSGMVVIEAEAPLASLFGYSSAMRSLSQGRASCSMEPKTYGPAPSEVLEKFM